MVSELLQDRPWLVKQMGSIIFILVYKWIFWVSTRLSELPSKNHTPAVPIQPKPNSMEAFTEGSYCDFFLWPFSGAANTCGKTLSDLSKDGSTLHASEGPALPVAAWSVRSPVLAPSHGKALPHAERAVVAAAAKPQGSSGRNPSSLFLQQVLFLLLIHEARKYLNSWSSTRGLTG